MQGLKGRSLIPESGILGEAGTEPPSQSARRCGWAL